MAGLHDIWTSLGGTQSAGRGPWAGAGIGPAARQAKSGAAIDRLARSITYLRGTHRPAAAPLELVIELTNRCHLKCPICPRESARRPAGDMPWEMFVDLVAQAEGLGVRVIDLCLAGESLHHPRVLDAVREVKSRGLLAYLQTSGAPLDEPMAHGLVGAGLDILSFSIDAATERTYEKVRPGADFASVTANVQTFLDLSAAEKAAGRPAPFTIVQMILQDANAGEVEEFRRRWARSGADLVRLKPLGTNDELVKGGAHRPEVDGASWLHSPPCTRPWRGMAVTWAGHVLACCYDFRGVYPLGDAAREGLAAIWSGERLAQLRRMHAEGKGAEMELCRECSFRRTGPASKLTAAASLLFDESQALKVLPWLRRPL